MTKYLLMLILCVAAVVIGMERLRGPGVNPAKSLLGETLDPAKLDGGTPIASVATDASPGKGEPVDANAPWAQVSEKPAVAREPRFSSDPPARAPASNLYATGDAANRERYRSALAELEVQACTSKGRFTVKTPASNGARTLVNGETLPFSGGLVLSLRLVDYRTCRVALYDGGQKVADTAAF